MDEHDDHVGGSTAERAAGASTDAAGRYPARGPQVVRRMTAALLVVLGVGNAALGVLVIRGVGSLLQTAPATGWGLLAAGPLLAALGVWLWRDGVTAARTAFLVVLALLLANAATASQTEGAPGRTVLLIVLALGCAASARSPRPSAEPAAASERAA